MLKGLLTAREGSYFKTEQEDELQVYRRRRIKEGAIKPEPRIEGEGRGFISSEKLAEITRRKRGCPPRPEFQTADVVAAAVHVDERWVPDSEGMDGTYKVPSLRHARWSGLNLKDMEHGIPPLPEEASPRRGTRP